MDTSTLSSFDRSYVIGRLKREARGMRLEAARAASLLAAQLTSLAATIEAEATALEFGFDETLPAWSAHP
ncbi:MAG TPA: hypothetical protein VGF92_13360 [Stellaceae bacterium]|jgi:uncharacterized membrane-anchored protein